MCLQAALYEPLRRNFGDPTHPFAERSMVDAARNRVRLDCGWHRCFRAFDDAIFGTSRDVLFDGLVLRSLPAPRLAPKARRLRPYGPAVVVVPATSCSAIADWCHEEAPLIAQSSCVRHRWRGVGKMI